MAQRVDEPDPGRVEVEQADVRPRRPEAVLHAGRVGDERAGADAVPFPALEELDVALEDASMEMADVQAVFFGNAVAGTITGQEMVRGQVTLRPAGVHSIPVMNVENACASASSALHLAWLSVARCRTTVRDASSRRQPGCDSRSAARA